jgi:hypothetical protein
VVEQRRQSVDHGARIVRMDRMERAGKINLMQEIPKWAKLINEAKIKME